MRILIAEEDPALANFVRKRLESEHYAVDISHEGDLAKSMACEMNYDLVVLDLNLAQADGVAILRHLRAKKHADFGTDGSQPGGRSGRVPRPRS